MICFLNVGKIVIPLFVAKGLPFDPNEAFRPQRRAFRPQRRYHTRTPWMESSLDTVAKR